MADTADPRSGALEGAVERRLAMKASLSAVETAAASPSGAPGWLRRLGDALEDLAVALEVHIDEVERSDGLLSDLASAAPRLIPRIDRLRDEHPDLRAQIGALLALVRSDPAPTDPEEVRAAVLDGLVALARHRQRGADLVYDVHNVDIGGG